MKAGDHTTEDDAFESAGPEQAIETHPALVIAWSNAEPRRIGETAVFPSGTARILGRGDSGVEGSERVRFFRQRPQSWQAMPPLAGHAISRRQLSIRSEGGRLHMESVGRAPLRVDGRITEQASVEPGQTLQLGSQLLLLCVERPSRMRGLRAFPESSAGQFGEPDAFGMVGESVAAWELRERTAVLAAAPGHVLVTGESGTGKEHVARMLHALSPRHARAMVSRSAATLPSSLIDAELFGNIRNYPNPSTPERPGLIGEAHRSTLFLDEIGELSAELQSHLLRVLDAGEYQRLGSATAQHSDLRLVCATNRPRDSLKHDLLARLTLRLALLGLDERREDIPLVMRALLIRAARDAPDIAGRFFADWDGTRGEPNVDIALVERLVSHAYTHHVRELEGLLWQSLAESRKNVLELTPELEGRLLRPEHRPLDVAEADVRRALERHSGNQSRAYRDLGLKNRYALIRLMKRHGIGGSGDD